MIKIDFSREMDRLAELMREAPPSERYDADYDAVFVGEDRWQAPPEACEIVRRVYWAASTDLLAFVREVCDDADDPEVIEAWESADPAPGVRWGRDHRIALVINRALSNRDIPAGDWSWNEWMRVAAGQPIQTVEHTTPGGRLVVVRETGRQESAPGQFFAALEGKAPEMINLPDRYLIKDAPGRGYGQTYAAPDFATLEEAATYADRHERQGEHLGELARRASQGKKSVRLSLRETELLEGAIRTAAASYRQQIPAAHLAEQSDLMAVTATMLVTANLETLQDDFSRAASGKALHGPIGIVYSDDDSDAWDQDAHELTLTYDGRTTAPAYLTLLAIYQANLEAGHKHAPTMELLDRLI